MKDLVSNCSVEFVFEFWETDLFFHNAPEWPDTRGACRHLPRPRYKDAAGMRQASRETWWCCVHPSYGGSKQFFSLWFTDQMYVLDTKSTEPLKAKSWSLIDTYNTCPPFHAHSATFVRSVQQNHFWNSFSTHPGRISPLLMLFRKTSLSASSLNNCSKVLMYHAHMISQHNDAF